MAIECTSIAIINMPRLIKGSTYTGIAPVSPRINRGMIQAAANRIQTETKETNTALFLIKSSRSSKSGSAGERIGHYHNTKQKRHQTENR